MTAVVQKYGGSSVATLDKMKQIAKRVSQEVSEGKQVVLVVSAMGKTTNALIEMAFQAQAAPNPREMDTLLSTGEQTSIALMAMTLCNIGVPAVSLTGYQAGIRTVGRHMKNKIDDIDIAKIRKHLDDGNVVVVAGFQGFNDYDEITTLGRGGSDTTAVALAAKLGCVCEIYTDVDGIYNVDPRRFTKARKLDRISYEEMKEMSHLGAKVMEPRSVEIGQSFGVPIWVKHSELNTQGTLIKEHDEEMEERGITGITISDDILMITIKNLPYTPENVAKLFESIADTDVLVDMISQTSPIDGKITISFTASKNDYYVVKGIVDAYLEPFEGVDVIFDNTLSKLSVVGMGMRSQTGIAAKAFRAFASRNIEFKQVSTSEISISYTLSPEQVDIAIEALNDTFSLCEDIEDERTA